MTEPLLPKHVLDVKHLSSPDRRASSDTGSGDRQPSKTSLLLTLPLQLKRNHRSETFVSEKACSRPVVGMFMGSVGQFRIDNAMDCAMRSQALSQAGRVLHVSRHTQCERLDPGAKLERLARTDDTSNYHSISADLAFDRTFLAQPRAPGKHRVARRGSAKRGRQ